MTILNERLQDILDECIASVLSGRDTVESCLAERPDVAGELEPLLRTVAQNLEELRVVAPDSFRETTRGKLMEKAREKSGARFAKNRRRPWTGKRSFLLRPVAIASILIVMLFAGTAVAATTASPDSPLYPIKRGLEEVRTATTLTDLGKVEIEANHANTRLDEIENMIDENKPEYVQDLLLKYDSHIIKAVTIAAGARDGGKDTAEVEATIREVQERHDRLLLGLLERVPEHVQEVTRDAMTAASPDREIETVDPALKDSQGVQGEQPGGSQMIPGGIQPEGGSSPGSGGSGMPDFGPGEATPGGGGTAGASQSGIPAPGPNPIRR